MKKDLDRFEELLKQHDYEALSPEDKEWVKQFTGSQEEYEALQRASLGLEKHFARTSPVLETGPSVLASLQQQFMARHEATHERSHWSIPAWAAMLAFVAAGGAGWYLGSASAPREVYVDRIVTQTDTIRVASRPDTVIVERVVYRQVPASIPATMVSQRQSVPPVEVRGVNMKEKEELEKFLVSGTNH